MLKITPPETDKLKYYKRLVVSCVKNKSVQKAKPCIFDKIAISLHTEYTRAYVLRKYGKAFR